MNKKLLFILGAILIFNCAGSGAGSTKIRDHRVTIGLATSDDFISLSNRVLNRHRFIVEQTEDRGAGSVIVCQYIYPAITNMEVLNGINEVRFQLSLESRVKGNGAGMYNIRAIVKSYGRPQGSEEWINIETNDATKKLVKAFANDLKMEFESRIRSF